MLTQKVGINVEIRNLNRVEMQKRVEKFKLKSVTHSLAFKQDCLIYYLQKDTDNRGDFY